jgi:hypothetical protein
MKLGILTKSAVIVTLMVSQITHQPSSPNYYEDDVDFNKVESIFDGGWGWGLNSAKADCLTSEEQSCYSVNPPGPLPEPWGGYDPYPDTPEDTGGSTSGGNGGGTPPPPEPRGELPKLEQCQLDVLKDKNDCVTKATIASGVQMIGCAYTATGGPIPPAICTAIVVALLEYNKGVCEEMYFEEMAWCRIENTTP